MKAIRTLQKRGTDDFGSGAFGAPRGNRRHRGIDYECIPGETILSPVVGRITKLGIAYSDDHYYRYVQITDHHNNRHRVFYVEPLVAVGQHVNIDSPIGKAQNISVRYSDKKRYMKPHIHLEIISDGKYINPEK